MKGVSYLPLGQAASIQWDVFIAITTSDALSLSPARSLERQAGLRIVWDQGAPMSSDLDAVQPHVVYAASNLLRDVLDMGQRAAKGPE